MRSDLTQLKSHVSGSRRAIVPMYHTFVLVRMAHCPAIKAWRPPDEPAP